MKLDLMAESFNLLNRDNQRVQITQDGFISNAAQFVKTDKTIGINIFPAQYRVPPAFCTPRTLTRHARYNSL